MNDHSWEEKLALRPEDLSPSERLALDAHLRECSTCSEIQARNNMLIRQLRALPPLSKKEPPPRLFPPRVERPDPETKDVFVIPNQDRYAGTYILGVQGTGKSGLLKDLIDHDAAAGQAVIAVDPHGDLIDHCLAVLPPHRLAQTYFLDMEDEAYPFGVNVFAAVGKLGTSVAQAQAVDRLMHIFEVLWTDVLSQQHLPRYIRAAAITFLSNPGATLVDMYAFLTDKRVRTHMLKQVPDLTVRQFWQTQFDDLSEAERTHRMQPLIGRLETLFMGRSLVRNIVGQRYTTIDFRQAIENKEIILIRLPIKALSQDARLIGTLLIAQLHTAIFSFADVPEQRRPGVSLYVDEFQHFATSDFAKLFTEGRKFGVKVTVAHQYRNQLPAYLRDATMTARTKVCFQTTPEDSREMSHLFMAQEENMQPENIDPYPVVHLLAYGSENPDVQEFIEWYLRPLQHHKRGNRVEIVNGGLDMVQGGWLENIRVADPTPYLDNLLYQAMRTGDATTSIPWEVVIGFSNAGCGFFATASGSRDSRDLTIDVRFPQDLVAATADGKRWTRPPESEREQFYHFLFYLRMTMLHLAQEPIGKKSAPSASVVGQMLTHLPRRTAFAKSGKDVGVIYTHNVPSRVTGAQFQERLRAIQAQTRRRYCRPKDQVDREFIESGRAPRQPHAFQRRVHEAIASGRNVILQAPTGAGKTRAALLPFLENLTSQEKVLPFTCCYVAPPGVLTNQFHREYQLLLKSVDNSLSTHLEQTSQQIEKAELTVCTLDQLLAGFLDMPDHLGYHPPNLNSSVLRTAYLVLDEFHLYPASEGTKAPNARTLTIQMLRFLQTNAPFILMTATFSSALLSRLQALLDAEVISITDEEERAEIDQGRMRTFWCASAPLDAETILVEHRQRSTNKCTLVVCNTVERAQHLYLRLKQAESEGTHVILLHSRFTSKDLHTRSQEVEDELGPEKWRNGKYLGRDLIVVATPVVEVGLDISVEVLHTEIAPANSLIQRAGRCARFAQQQGQVWIYPPSPDEDLSALPYNQDLCTTTWNALETFHGKTIGFLQEQMLIDTVHTREDEAFLDQCEMDESSFLEQVFTSLKTSSGGISSSLMQDSAQVQVLVHDDPNSAILEAPWKWEHFSIPPSLLMVPSYWQSLQKRATQSGLPVCWEAVPITQEATDRQSSEDHNERAYIWKPVTRSNRIAKALAIAFPRQVARYDQELGLTLLDHQLAHLLGPADYQSTRLPEDVANDENRDGFIRTQREKYIL